MDNNKLRYPIGAFEPPAGFNQGKLEKWIYTIAGFPDELARVLEGVAGTRLRNTYREGGWNILQLVHHCADSHMNALMRFKLALTEKEPVIKTYNETAWAELPDGNEQNIHASMQIIKGVHARWTKILVSLSLQQWESGFFHPEHNRTISLYNSCALYAWHCRHHLAHITLALGLKT